MKKQTNTDLRRKLREQRAAYVAVGESAGNTSLTVSGYERHHAIGETVEPAQGFHQGCRVGNDMR